MTKETTIITAETIVINAENKYLNELVNDIETAEREGRECEHDMLVDELMREGKRVNKKPLQEFDEEERIIGNIIMNKKHKK